MVNLDIEKLAFEFQTTEISLTKMAAREHTTRQTLAKYFKDLGIEVVNKQNVTKFDEHIFDEIDTEEKAYWLGFLFADGGLSSHPENGKARYEIELSLKNSDKEHLHKFNKFMKCIKDNVKTSKVKAGGKEYARCRWRITNKHLWETLNNYGCTPQKSLTLEFPEELIFSDKSLIRHFIRGYFDGDGCLTRYVSAHTVTPHVTILGTPEFLHKLESYIPVNIKYRHDKRHTEHTLMMEFNKEEGIKFLNYIYFDSNIYLDRKYKLYYFFKDGSRSVEEFTELLETNIGESCDANPEINSEIKESESSYSVETETEKSE